MGNNGESNTTDTSSQRHVNNKKEPVNSIKTSKPANKQQYQQLPLLILLLAASKSIHKAYPGQKSKNFA